MSSFFTVPALAAPIVAGGTALLLPLLPVRAIHIANRILATIITALALMAASQAAFGSGQQSMDALSGVFVGVSAVVGFFSAIISPAYLHHSHETLFRRGPRWYYLGFYIFWGLLLAIPQSTNLGVAWLLIEATTGASALLVAYSGTQQALEAGWKYLVLTTLGLTVTLAGIVTLYGMTEKNGQGLAALDWSSLHAAASTLPAQGAVIAFILVVVGLAAKIGWAPVHNWLPDAHSQAPAPVSALLSAALLPTVMLIAWRVQIALSPGPLRMTHTVFIAFGLVSLAVSVPFLWTPLPIKRLLAYSSLEHIGVMALGIGFANPLALAGVLLHVCSHAIAKALGFYSAIPLFRLQPKAFSHPATGVGHVSPSTATGMTLSLGSLMGLPPSPLFFSELFILMGGIAAGYTIVVGVMTILLACGFIGIVHQTIEGVLGHKGHTVKRTGSHRMWTLNIALGSLLTVLAATAYFLPDSPLVNAIARIVL